MTHTMSGTMPNTETADLFLASVQHEKYKNVGLAFPGQKNKRIIGRNALKDLKVACQRMTWKFRSSYINFI